MPNAIAKASKHELKCAWDILAQAAAKQQHQEQQEGQGAGQSRAIDGIDGRPASCPCPCPCRRLLLPLPCCDLNRNGATRGRQNQIEVCPVAAADSSPSPSRPLYTFFSSLSVSSLRFLTLIGFGCTGSSFCRLLRSLPLAFDQPSVAMAVSRRRLFWLCVLFFSFSPTLFSHFFCGYFVPDIPLSCLSCLSLMLFNLGATHTFAAAWRLLLTVAVSGRVAQGWPII